MFGISRYCSSLVSFSFPSHRPSQSRYSLRTSDRDFCFESLGSRQNFQYGLIKHSSKKFTIPSTTETGFDGQKHVCIFADAILAHEAGTVRTRAGSNLKLLQTCEAPFGYRPENPSASTFAKARSGQNVLGIPPSCL